MYRSAFLLEGSRTSYAQFQQWELSLPAAALSFQFRTTERAGLLLYTDSRAGCRFLQLKLVQGGVRAHFRQHTETGRPARSPSPFRYKTCCYG